jgi:Fe-S cluster assembly ATP-binding protein
MLKIKNLHVSVEDNEILKGFDLQIKPGEVHAIMGPNGSGKSTLAHVLAGREDYDVTEGIVEFDGRYLLDMSIEERAREGLFLAFQYPVELPGVNSTYFLRSALNAQRKHRGLDEISGKAFLQLIREKMELLQIKDAMLNRSVNEGFSGGEKKRHEVLQMAVLAPKMAVLDETDSGLDIDALQIVAKGVNALRSSETSQLVITHYQRLLDYIVPDVVHVQYQGRIVHSGGKDLALKLEKEGYGWVERDLKAS